MTRPRTIEMRQINISMHAPHSPQGYVDLFQKAFDAKRVKKRGKADGYLLGALYGAKDAVEKNELQGEIYRFTNIDPNAPWFNTQTGKPAEDADTQKILIPENLQPNLEPFPFVFRPKEHRLWYVSRNRQANLGPSVVESFLKKTFDEISLEEHLPLVEVTTVPDEAALDEVLALHRMTKLVLEFKRPNADDAGDIEKLIMERMARRKVNRVSEVMTSTDPGGIKPDDALKAEAQVAAHNGYVQSFGYDAAGRRADESTKAKPAKYIEIFDEAIETIWNVLGRVTSIRQSKGSQQ